MLQLKISDLTDDVHYIFDTEQETETEDVKDLDTDRIKRMVNDKLEATANKKGIHNKRKTIITSILLAAAIASFGAGKVIIGAGLLSPDQKRKVEEMEGYTGRLITVAPEKDLEIEINTRGEPVRNPDSHGLIDESYMDKIREMYFDIRTIELKQKKNTYEIPDMYILGCCMSIFCQENQKGWELKKGQKIRFSYNIDNGNTSMDACFIRDDEYIHVKDVDDSEHLGYFEYEITADKDGTYYLAIGNIWGGNVEITNGEIHISD